MDLIRIHASLHVTHSVTGQCHDDVIKWKHFPRYWPLRIHRPPVNSPHKGQWRGALMFSFICAWMNGWVNNGEAGDLIRHCAHYDVIVMTTVWNPRCYQGPLLLTWWPEHGTRISNCVDCSLWNVITHPWITVTGVRHGWVIISDCISWMYLLSHALIPILIQLNAVSIRGPSCRRWTSLRSSLWKIINCYADIYFGMPNVSCGREIIF